MKDWCYEVLLRLSLLELLSPLNSKKEQVTIAQKATKTPSHPRININAEPPPHPCLTQPLLHSKPFAYQNATRTKKTKASARSLAPDTSHVIAQPGPREWNVGATHHHTTPFSQGKKGPGVQRDTRDGAISLMYSVLSTKACTCEKIASRPRVQAASCFGRRGFGDDTRVR